MSDELELVTAERDMLLLQVDQLTHVNAILRDRNVRHPIDLAAMREAMQDHHDLHHRRARPEPFSFAPIQGEQVGRSIKRLSEDFVRWVNQ